MRTMDRPLIVLAIGALALWTSLTDAILQYLRPSMRPWVVLAGAVLVAVGLASLVLARRAVREERALALVHAGGIDPVHPHDDDHHGLDDQVAPDCCNPSGGHEHGRVGRVGWVLLLPVIAAVLLDPGALGAYAVSRQSQLRLVSAGDFDLEQHLRAHSFGGQTPDLKLSQFTVAARNPDERELLSGTTVALTGFVVHEEGPPNSFLLARLQIGCCAGDAIAAIVDVRDYEGPTLDEETWVEVIGRYDQATTEVESKENGWYVSPILTFESLRQIDAPSEPYEYP